MERDETGTLASLKAHLAELVVPQIAEHGGRIVKSLGDGVLAEFASVVSAVQCAANLQHGMMSRNASITEGERLQFRIGINLGDVIIEGDDIFGDGVNIAARLETMAEPGGIVVSQAVYEEIRKKTPYTFVDMGARRLRNIAEPIRMFQLAAFVGSQNLSITGAFGSIAAQKPIVAVLPFNSMSGDKEQEYFTDGVVEDIITALSHFRDLIIIARNSTYVYKDKIKDVRRIAGELGVRYVVEGSFRRIGDRVRLTAQLIDSSNAAHLWADRFDANVSDIFSVQDKIVDQIVSRIAPQVRSAEIERARRKPTGRLDAYDYYLRALPYRDAMTREAYREALVLLRKAIELDPSYAPALAHAAMCHSALRDQGMSSLSIAETKEAIALAEAAVEADMDDPIALCLSGQVLAGLAGEIERGTALIDRALEINPNHADGWSRSSMVRIYAGELQTALLHADRAIALSPLGPALFLPLCAKAYARLFGGEWPAAVALARSALRGKQKPPMAFRIIVAAFACLGDAPSLQRAKEDLLNRDPSFRISTWQTMTPFTREEQLNLLLDSFRRAGLPD